MAVTDEILKDIVERKEQLRHTNLEIAKHYGVSERTISRWTQETGFGRLRE
jgi:transposase